tara:strand:- start:2246 stop:3094 length:849 start_codon:yes stop_codon:yes gene_type:complete
MADIKKSGNISNDTGSAYSNVTNTQAKINNIQERFDDTTDNDNPYDGAIQYINKKVEETIDIVNLLEVNSSDGASVATYAMKLKSNPSIGGVQFPGTGDINLPGVNIAGNQDTSGNAASATKLATARTIGGTSFDGTGNIVPATATNTVGYKNSATNYKLMPADFYMMNSTSNYAGGYITIPASGECHAQLTLPLESTVFKKDTTIYSSATVTDAVEIWMVPFDGVSVSSRRIGSGALGKAINLNDSSQFDASKYYLWIKITLGEDVDAGVRIYGGDVGFGQ